MDKKLSEMSLQELWMLFPIFLTEHKSCWKSWYNDEETFLRSVMAENKIERISHIGSTSVETIWAKPIIDIMVEVSESIDMKEIKAILIQNGYTCMSEEPSRISFNKGYTSNGFDQKVFHLHLRYSGDNNELYFRDYLNQYAEIAKEYEILKLSLWKKYEHNRDAYTNAKTEFIQKHTHEAKKLYGQRYK